MKYIGIVDWANEDRNGNKIAGIKPLYEVSDSEWKLADTSEFQPDGKVFWYKSTGKQNDLIFFTVKESFNFNEEQYRYHLDRSDSVMEIIDFRNLGTVENVRKAIANGLRYSGHLPNRAYILCKGGSIVGPLKLSRSGDNLLRFEVAQIHEIPCYSTDDTPIQEIRLESGTRMVCQDKSPLNIRSYVDWDSNRNVIKRAVEYAVNNSKKMTGTVINVKDLVADTYEQLKEGDDGAKLSLQINRLKRTVEIIQQVEVSSEWATELIHVLLSSPTIEKEFDSIRAKTRKEETENIKKELAYELNETEKVRIEKKKVEQDIQESVKYLEEIKDEIKNELDSHTKDIDFEIEKKIEAIVNKPAGFIAEAAFLKAVLPHLVVNKNSKPTNPNFAEPTIKWNVSDNKISTADELKRLIIKAFRIIGVKSDVGIGIHAAVTAGVMPILSGFNAGAAIDVYSRITCGGRLFRVPISPTSIEVADLIGRYDGSLGSAAKRGGNLLEFLEIAKRNPEPAIIVFEGINRAPTESYFMPIMEAIFFRRSLPLFFDGDAEQNFEWAENLLPMATIVEGPTTLPLSMNVWSRSILLDASSQYSMEGYTALSNTAFSEIDLSSELFDQLENIEFDIIKEIFEQFPEFEYFQKLTSRFTNGLMHFYDLRDENDQSRVRKILIDCLILPLVAITKSDEEKDAAIKKLMRLNINEYQDAQTVRTCVNRIAEKIS